MGGAGGEAAPLVSARPPSLTIFFPMWNEQQYLRATIAAAVDVCDRLVDDGELAGYDLLIIDDASTDATPALADEVAAAMANVQVVHHPTNRGLGGSIKTGFAHAGGDLVLYTDADLPCDLAELGKACRLLRYHHADIVAAYRHDRTGEGTRRAVYSWVYNWLIRLAFGVYIRDVNFAFKLCRRSIFETVHLDSEGSFIDAELLIRAANAGMHTIQFGVDYFPRSRGVSTLSSGAVVRHILREMWQLRHDLRRGPSPAGR